MNPHPHPLPQAGEGVKQKIKLTAINSLPGDYWLVDFSIQDKQGAILLEKFGLIQYQDTLWPVVFFNHHIQTGQLLIHKTSLIPIENLIEVELPVARLTTPPADKKVIILASGMGLGYALFLAKKWKNLYPLVLLEAKESFPFAITPSKFLVKELPSFVTAGVKVLEDLGVVSRLATEIDKPGCFHGEITALMDDYLKNTPHLGHTIYRFLGTHFI